MIRPAKLSDYGAITTIRESVALDIGRIKDAEYRVEVQHTGFLLPTGLNIEDFKTDISSYIVAERDGQVVGYLRLTDGQDMSPETAANWLRPDLRDVYYAIPHAYIWGFGVLPDANHNGVATELLKATEQQVRAKNVPWLFSEIVTSPLTNIASMLFHEKYGFERIALVEPYQAYGMDGFQYLLYGKQLS